MIIFYIIAINNSQESFILVINAFIIEDKYLSKIFWVTYSLDVKIEMIEDEN